MADREVDIDAEAQAESSLSRRTGVLVALIGTLVLGLGWAAGLDSWRRLEPGLASMKPNTALCFVAIGVALALCVDADNRRKRWLVRGLASVALVLSGLTLGADILDVPLGLDELLFSDPNPLRHPHPGRMSPATAAAFLLSAVALLVYRPRRPANHTTHVVGWLVAVNGLVALTGYAYGVRALYEIEQFRSMAMHTAICLVLVGAGLIALPRRGRLVAMLAHRGLHGQMARRLLPAALVPLVFGWLVVEGLEAGLYRPSFALVLAALPASAVLLVIVGWTGQATGEAETARDRALERLREQTEWLEITLRSIGEGVVATDIDGVVTFVNPVASRMIGSPVDQIERRPIEASFVIRGEDSDEPAHNPVRLVLASGRPSSLDARTDLISRGGERVPIADGCAPILDERGQVRGAVLVFYDASDERESARALADAARHKDEFLAMLGHELRNPLSTIAYATEMLRGLPRRASGMDPALDVLDRQIKHMTRLVDDLLDVSRIVHGNLPLVLEPLDLVEILGSVVDDHRANAEAKQVLLELRLAVERVPLQGDPARLYQVFDNLLSNAIAFTKSGGIVTVELELDEANERARVQVVDTGIGVSPEGLATMFEPFRQGRQPLDRPHGGLGLGLSLVKGIVELHGGAVEASSEGRGAGTRLAVSLPLAGPSS